MTLTRYSIWSIGRSTKLFYVIYIAIFALMMAISGIAVIVADGKIDFEISGFDTAPMVFAFVSGIVAFSEFFRVGISNSHTRKEVHFSFLKTSAVFAVVMSIANNLFRWVTSYLLNSKNTFSLLYAAKYGDRFSFTNILSSILWEICLLMMLFVIGFLIGLLYYKFNKLGRVILTSVAFGLPFFILPMIDGVLTGGKTVVKVFQVFLNCLGVTSCNPFIAMLSFAVVILVVSAVSFLLITRLPFNSKRG